MQIKTNGNCLFSYTVLSVLIPYTLPSPRFRLKEKEKWTQKAILATYKYERLADLKNTTLITLILDRKPEQSLRALN